MSEALIGTIVGGAIALAASAITQIFVYTRWKKERRLEYLNAKRERLAKRFSELAEQLKRCLNEGPVPHEMGATFEFLTPPRVAKVFLQLVEENPEDHADKQQHLMKVIFSMKQELASLEEEIEDCL